MKLSTVTSQRKKIVSRLSLLLLCSCVFLSGCETNNTSEPTTQSQNTSFNAYLRLKNIPENDKKRIETERNRFQRREKLAETVLKQNLLADDLLNAEVNEYKKQLIISRYFDQFLKEKVSDQAIRNYYSINATKYQSKKAHVAHVLIRTNSKMSKEEREALLTKAHEVYSKANANEDFMTLAKAYSDDKLSAKKGGDLGWIKEGAIDPVFSKKVFELKQGDISEPITTPFGFHIVKVLDEAKIIKQPFETVKGNIRYELRQLAKHAEKERLLKLAGLEN